MEVLLRRLRAEDISQVVEIEREAFSPLWTATPFKRELTNRYARYLVACLSTNGGNSSEAVPEESLSQDGSSWHRLFQTVHRRVKPSPVIKIQDSLIAGYVSVWFQLDQSHLTEVAVRKGFRGQGIGELLLIGTLDTAIEHGSSVVTLEVRVSNFIAQALYEKYGFTSVGLRKAYYSDNREDAVIMTTDPIQTEDYQKKLHLLKENYRSRWREIRCEV